MQLLNREQKDINGRIRDFFQILLQLAAVRTIGIGKHRHFAASVAFDFLDGEVERKLLKRESEALEFLVLDFPLPGISEINLGFGLNQTANNEVSEIRIGVDDFSIDQHFV